VKTESIVIVEDEPDIAKLMSTRLSAEGFRCVEVGRGDEVLDVAVEERPELVILDLMLPGLDGIEVCRLLRKDPRTAGVGIIMVTARSLARDRIAGLEAGADDYLDKPFHLDELIARVQTSFRRGRQLRATSPLTGLPGNFEIEARIDAKLQSGEPFALLHADIDLFKGYNDHYGFLRGDRAIVLTARIIQSVVAEVGANEAFVGHIGGDDFAVLCLPEFAERIAERVIGRFDSSVPALYDPDDREAGFTEGVDRSGVVRRRPLISLSVGIASTEMRTFASSAEVAAVAVEMKGFAKAEPGSAWRIDRRRSA
jgi:PleD family two-component response regulator